MQPKEGQDDGAEEGQKNEGSQGGQKAQSGSSSSSGSSSDSSKTGEAAGGRSSTGNTAEQEAGSSGQAEHEFSQWEERVLEIVMEALRMSGLALLLQAISTCLLGPPLVVCTLGLGAEALVPWLVAAALPAFGSPVLVELQAETQWGPQGISLCCWWEALSLEQARSLSWVAFCICFTSVPGLPVSPAGACWQHVM